MMKKQIAGLVLALSVIGGVGTGVLANALTEDEPAAADPTSAPTSTTTRPTPVKTTISQPITDPKDFVLAPGKVGQVLIGMSKQEAVDTGYFVKDVPPAARGCVALPVVWKDEYANAFDVLTLGNGEIVSIGVYGEGITTAAGIGVGSTYDEVHAAYPEEQLVEAGYAQSGLRVFNHDNGGWIGFLFDPAVDKVRGDSPVKFVEVTKGAEPGLMRDGC